MNQKSDSILNTFKNAPEDAKNLFVELYRDKALDNKFVDDYVDLIQENGHTTIGFNYLVMVAKWNQWYQRNYYYTNSCQLLTSIQSVVGMRQKPEEVKQFEQWYYKSSDKDKLAGYANFRNKYPQYDTLLLQNPFINFKYHDWYDRLGYQTLHSLNFQGADVEKTYSEHCLLEPIKDACRQEFKIGVLYSKQEVKSKLQQIYDDLGLVGKTAKATELAQYLPVQEIQKSDTSGKRSWFIIVI